MSRRAEAHEESIALNGSSGRIRYITVSGGSYLDGTVLTEHGIVSVYSQSDFTPHTRYDFVWRGRLYIRTERRGRTERGLAIEATKFARRVARSRPSAGGRQP